VIDIHTHIGHLPGVVGDHYTADDLAYVIAHEGVSYALASSASTNAIGRHLGTPEAVDMVRRHGERLGGLLWVNPHDPTWAEDVPIAVAAGFKGIKIHPVLDHYEVNMAALDAVFACARENHWPILTHTHVDGTSQSANRYELLIRAYHDVPLILAHLRWEGIPLARRYDNVFLDTTYVDPMVVEIGVAALGPSKLLFGTDACEGFDVGHEPGRARPPRSYAGVIQALRDRGIADETLAPMLFDNARDLFGLAGALPEEGA
jgi:predicted TIM-barrel fold metal-dependent hydrolase